MKQKMKLLALFFLLGIYAFGQDNKILVTQTTVKVNSMGTEELYFGFNEGDEIIFNYELVKGKNLKEIEIFEYPNSSIFMDYKTKEIKDLSLIINKKGIYKFSFKNTAVTTRVCKIKIERIPASSENSRFNTTVYWKTIHDTSYYFVDEDYLISKDTAVSNITDQVVKVHSSININGNKSTFNFLLPRNTVAWSYYVGVDQAGQEAFAKATKEFAQNAGPIIAKIPGYGPLAALALGGTSYITQLQKGEDIDFYIVMGQNVNLFLAGQEFYYIKRGKVINDFSQMTAPLKGGFHFCFFNDNAITGVSVYVKVTAITVTENWGIRNVEKFKVKTWKEPYLIE